MGLWAGKRESYACSCGEKCKSMEAAKEHHDLFGCDTLLGTALGILERYKSDSTDNLESRLRREAGLPAMTLGLERGPGDFGSLFADMRLVRQACEKAKSLSDQHAKSTSEESRFDFLIGIGHQVKGQEYDNVVLCGRFASLLTKDDATEPPTVLLAPPKPSCGADEFNMHYVCATRARRRLVLNGQLQSFLDLQWGSGRLVWRTPAHVLGQPGLASHARCCVLGGAPQEKCAKCGLPLGGDAGGDLPHDVAVVCETSPCTGCLRMWCQACSRAKSTEALLE